MPSKRVSLKGKGVDLFFGDYAPPSQTAPDAAADDTADPRAAPAAPSDLDATTSANYPAPVAFEPDAASASSPRPASRPRRSPRSGSVASTPASNGASSLDSNRASVLASTVDVASSETVEAIRKIVKTPGKEVSFVRLTPEEKAQLVDLVYTFKRQGQKTSETEINRIALNYLLHDFQEHGEHSVLARVLAALLA